MSSSRRCAVVKSQLGRHTSDPSGIAAGPDAALWFTEEAGNQIGRITTAGVITEFPITTANIYFPVGIVAGPDGVLWFTGGGAIGRITTAGVITAFQMLSGVSSPYGIATGPGGTLWFTVENPPAIGDRIGRITPDGMITEFPVSTPNSRLQGIAAGPDGALWFTEYAANKIGRITQDGVVTEYPVPTADSNPPGIAAGPDGALWFTEFRTGKIGRAPACGLGFSASFANSTLTMNFHLGVDTPATFDIVLRDSTGPFAQPFSQAIPAVVPPQAFTMNWGNFPNKGEVTVVPLLTAGPGQGLCAEWATVDTAQ